MPHTVIKIGGSVLGGPADADRIRTLVAARPAPVVLVVSALRGLTDELVSRARAPRDPDVARNFADRLRVDHAKLAAAFRPPEAALRAVETRLDALHAELIGLFAGDAPDRYPRLASIGERFAAAAALAAFASLGRSAALIEPGELGLVARGGVEDAELDFGASVPRVRARLQREGDAVVPGFFGVGPDGLVRLFGRGGSDYSAASIAAAAGARACVLVKDAEGIRTADPRIVPGSRVVRELSYREAAALSRGGAKVLHERAVDPLEAAGIPLSIVGDDGSGTLVTAGVAAPEAPRHRHGSRIAASRVRAIALTAGPAGSATLTLAGEGAGRSDLPRVLDALEGASVGPWSIQGGEGHASVRVLVPSVRGADALKAIHAALFERGGRRARP